MRGPLVYCAEGTDNTENLNGFVIPGELPEPAVSKLAELGGAVVVDLVVPHEDTSSWSYSLYCEAPAERTFQPLCLVPYHLWDNRQDGAMLVWFQSDKTFRVEGEPK